MCLATGTSKSLVPVSGTSYWYQKLVNLSCPLINDQARKNINVDVRPVTNDI